MVDARADVAIKRDTKGRWRVYRNGIPFEIRGAGGHEHLELLRDSGGNTVRTWGIEQLEGRENGQSLLDIAHDLGLAVIAGIWLEHPRHGHDYGDPDFLQFQREHVRTVVQKYRDHPALLMWGLGNEMEGTGDDPRIWQELEVLAQIVKTEDSAHPICTALAGTDNNKVARMQEHYHSLDILGINCYGGAPGIAARLRAQGWNRPYMLTEFGPVGHWEIASTEWDAPLEPTSIEKADTYAASHRAQLEHGRGLCLGSFCFLWGHKQETTATWFGMFLPTGEKTPAVDQMIRLWTGREPANRAPLIYALHSELDSAVVSAGTEWTVSADAIDPDGEKLHYEWQVIAETTDRKSGGDFEMAPPTIPDCVVFDDGRTARIRVPHQPGAYRVFLFVRDGKGGGAAGNFPFMVE